MLPHSGLDVPALLRQQAERHGDRPFLTWAPFEGAPQRWTYLEFAEAVDRVAGGLAARGVAPGQRVMTFLSNCPQLLLAWFACARLGAVCVLASDKASGPDLAWCAELTGASAAISTAGGAALLRQHCPGLRWIATVEEGLPSGAPPPARPADPAALCCILFTSGTTSRAKGVAWTHANAVWAARLGALQQALRTEDVYQVCLPLFHVVGLAWSVLPALWAGAEVVLQPRFSASRYWDAALAHGCTVASHVQFTSGVLARQPVPAGHRFRQWGNSVWRPELAAHFGIPLLGWWGMTEVVSQGIVGDPAAPPQPGAIGLPSLGYQLKVVDEAGEPVRPGEVGDLLIQGQPGLSIFAGYYNDAAATAAAFDAEGWFRTGDRVVVVPDGAIRFVERAKDVIKVGGENVSAGEVERVVKQLPAVEECGVVGRPDPTWGERVVAFVTLRAPCAEEAIRAHCQAALPRYAVPDAVVVLAEMPRVSLGKVAKGELRRLLPGSA